MPMDIPYGYASYGYGYYGYAAGGLSPSVRLSETEWSTATGIALSGVTALR